MPRRTLHTVFQLRIELRDVKPPVWRRVLVSGDALLATLHDVFQVAMGWTNSHLHSFTIGEECYGLDDEDAPEDQIDDAEVFILDAIRDQKRFAYEYDFGDGWEHDVEVEASWSIPRQLKFAVCTGGENACPPEDCGGPRGYERLLEVVADPSHPEHDELAEWLGGPFDRTAFGLAGVNAELQRLGRR